MVATQLLTAQDLWNLQDGEDFELIEGALSPVSPTGGEHGEIQADLIRAIGNFLDGKNLGAVYGDVGYLLRQNPDTVLGPDLSVIASERIPADRRKFLPLAPDLAVEIISPSNSPGEIERKIAIYLQAGTRLVWVVYPRQRQVVVHTPGDAPQVFGASDELPGGDVLPGLVIPVASIFR
jgi:Uma2 family endonuclease